MMNLKNRRTTAIDSESPLGGKTMNAIPSDTTEEGKRKGEKKETGRN